MLIDSNLGRESMFSTVRRKNAGYRDDFVPTTVHDRTQDLHPLGDQSQALHRHAHVPKRYPTRRPFGCANPPRSGLIA